LIKVLVIDDSAFNRVTLTRLLESSGDVRVVASAVNGEDGIKQVLRHRPDVITLDLEMPVMDGFAFLRWLMANVPTPVIVISSRSSDRSVFKALELGALDFLVKPGGRVSVRLEEIQQELLSKVRQSTEAKVENLQLQLREHDRERTGEAAAVPPAANLIDLVVIGSSTGGPPALQSVFEKLPLMLVPIVVAQHMPPVFTRLFAERLNRLTPYDVKEAADGELLAPGVIYIAPGGLQTEVVGFGSEMKLQVSERTAEDLYAPSVNRLFVSASNTCSERLLAVILTGMGDDGSTAIRKVRARGGRTVAESATTAIIFGMPGEAIRTGAIEEVLPLDQIPAAIHRVCSG
jgi:two-component system, chemotaxis family, protein-glutamate methylesterase/glutaminase